MINDFLQEHYESDLINHLKKIYRDKVSLSQADLLEMKAYETEDYALLGIIGLILNSKPHILLGKKQPFDQEIRQLCDAIPVSQNDLMDIADKYLDDDFSQNSEFILRKVMLEYPNKEHQ
ncbi:MAG: hypothetical protein R2728_16145 [Chitinophagales bacterium]